jgi:hypothetical protein
MLKVLSQRRLIMAGALGKALSRGGAPSHKGIILQLDQLVGAAVIVRGAEVWKLTRSRAIADVPSG